MEAFLTVAPSFTFWAVFLLAVVSYLSRRVRILPRISYRFLAWFTVAFYAAYAALLTLGQYLLWKEDWFGKQFLDFTLSSSLPIPLVRLFPGLFGGRFGYFLFYSWGRFWVHALLAVGVALCFWWFLRALRRRNERFFEEGETELGFLAALIAGWPHVLVFIVIAFLCVVLFSVVRLAWFKESFTTLGAPFLVGAGVALLWGNVLASLIGVSVLAV